MSKANLPGKRPQLSSHVGGDIPEAVRETLKPTSPPRPWSHQLIWVGITIVVLGLGLFFALRAQQAGSPGSPQLATSDPRFTSPTATPQGGNPDPTLSPSSMLGHFPYEEAPAADLAPIVADGSILMHKDAAKKYQAMAAAADAAGVKLVPLSGFRSIEDQEHLFFEVKAERGQRPTERASVSAPPGFSEHHTGYAIDIGDADAVDTNLSNDFEKTAAFRWLEQNAAYYSFEMSFPKNNPQGVSYEPWHWRYVGDSKSLATFYKARAIKPVTSPTQ